MLDYDFNMSEKQNINRNITLALKLFSTYMIISLKKNNEIGNSMKKIYENYKIVI